MEITNTDYEKFNYHIDFKNLLLPFLYSLIDWIEEYSWFYKVKYWIGIQNLFYPYSLFLNSGVVSKFNTWYIIIYNTKNSLS